MSDLNNKVVYTALTRMTEDRDVIKHAFQSWQAKFAGQELDVFAFVDHIQTYLGLETGEKKVLMMSMHAASSKGGLGLKEVPEYILGSFSADQASGDDEAGREKAGREKAGLVDSQADSAIQKAPYILLAEFYLSNMLDGTQKLNGKLASEVRDLLADEGLPNVASGVQLAVKSVDGDRINLPASLAEAECKSFCLELYMLVCDVAGPMKADDISYKAIANMLETNEASRYDPRDLI